jgi:hypothetical protein
MAGCGGGSGSGSGGGKIKKNEFLGNLPALYDGYNSEKAAMEAKLETESNKLMAGGEKNYDKVQKLFDDQSLREEELEEKLIADMQAELSKLAGKAIPVVFSQKLRDSGTLFFDIADAALVDDRGEVGLSFNIKAREDFTIPSMKAYDYTIFYRLTGDQGATLENSVSAIIPVPLDRQAKSFAKGELLNSSKVALNLGRYAADRAAFSGIEFITKEEYDSFNAQ